MIENWVIGTSQKKLNQEYIDINKEFESALELMENSSEHVFITGRAGTGKSTLLRYFRENTKKKVVVLAPTGLAAINVGGQTIHSFFRFPPRIIDSKDVKRRNSKLYKEIDAIVIDEVSMVRADLLDGIDLFLRKNRDFSRVFGGVQVILFGDLFQLPPVVNEDEHIISKRYESPYFFSSKVFEKISFKIIELDEVYRQKERRFVEILDLIRTGEIKQAELDLINSRVTPNLKEDAVILTPTNRVAEAINHDKLNKLPGKQFTYTASLDGRFKQNETSLPVYLNLSLKKGARVIFVKNDLNGQWVNGTLGEVYDLSENWIKVKLDDSTVVDVKKDTWEKIEYQYDNSKDEIVTNVVGKLKQFPLKLAWALTIHKSQGQTFENVVIDLSTHPWDHGQTYVALSRCRTIDSLNLRRKIFLQDILVDSRIKNFIKNNYKAHKTLQEF